MACNSCSKPFSLFRKEKGCPGCGFSYCSKCLVNKIFIIKLNAEAKVCAKCKRYESKPSEPATIEAPDAYYRRISAMEEKPGDISKTTTNADSIDQHIVQRLQKLKEGRNISSTAATEEDIKKRLINIKGGTPTSDGDLHSRLAKLKGLPIEVVGSVPVLPPPETRSEQEQANDLIKQYMEQTKIDTKYQDGFDEVISDIESRMLQLKGTNPTPQSTLKIQENDKSEDEEETVRNIVKKIIAESSLEKAEITFDKSDELPFCEICNEDAKMRCLGCRYLFCKRCFTKHKDDDDGCNRYEPYEAPTGMNE